MEDILEELRKQNKMNLEFYVAISTRQDQLEHQIFHLVHAVQEVLDELKPATERPAKPLNKAEFAAFKAKMKEEQNG